MNKEKTPFPDDFSKTDDIGRSKFESEYLNRKRKETGKKGNPTGRTNPESAEEIIQQMKDCQMDVFMRLGLAMRQAAFRAGDHKLTLYNKVTSRRHKEGYEELNDFVIDCQTDKLLRALNSESQLLDMNDSRVTINTLRARLPEIYGDKQHITYERHEGDKKFDDLNLPDEADEGQNESTD